MALKKGTKTMELVGPMGRGGGRHDLRLRGEGAREGGQIWARAGRSAEGHWTTKGPDSDGMVTVWTPGDRQGGRVRARSAKIWACVWAVELGK